MGLPLVIIHLNRIFPNKNHHKPSSYWVPPCTRNPPRTGAFYTADLLSSVGVCGTLFASGDIPNLTINGGKERWQAYIYIYICQ